MLITAELSGSAFSQDIQNKFNSLTKSFTNHDMQGESVTSFGVIRYALENRLLAQQEMSTIGAGSLLGIIFIFFFVFRRILLLPVILLPVMIGLLLAFSVSLLLFGEIHLVSLVFAASLIGVSIDYTLHYCCSNSNLTKTSTPGEALHEVLSALSIGLITSVLGYLTLSIADFPALRQMAVLAVTGLAGAYFTVLFWMPVLIKRQLSVQPSVVKWISKFASWIKARKEWPIWAIASIIVASFTVNLLIKNGQDDIKILRAHLPVLDRVQEQVQSIIGEFPNSQYFLIGAKTPGLTIQIERQLVKQLKDIRHEGGRVYAISEWLPDGDTQRSNNKLLKSALLPATKLDSYINDAGLPVSLIKKYRDRLATAKDKVMDIEEFVKSPLGHIHNQLWLGKLDDNYYSIVSLYGYMDLAALNELASNSPGVSFIDRSASVSHIFKKYRIKIERMFPFVILVIFLLLSWRYGLAGSFRIVSAPVLSALLSFLLMNLIMGEYNLFVIFGLVITVAISIDYAVFIRESKGKNESTYLAISLASLTTVLALGLLSLSHTPALSFFGLSLLSGVLFSFILTPLIVKPGRVVK
jgi:predicted exporter